MVDGQDLHLGREFRGALGEDAGRARGQCVLGADEVQPGAGGVLGAGRAGGGLVRVRGQWQRAYPAVALRRPLRLPPGPLADRREDDLDAGERLGGERVEQFGEVSPRLGAVHDDAQTRLHMT